MVEFNVAAVHEAIAERCPDRECIVWRDRRLTWKEVTARSRQLARVLGESGLGFHKPRSSLEPWESGQDHLALYLHNGNEYLEAMLGAFKARVAPLNVNYNYVEDELVYLLTDAGATGMVFHATFAPLVARVAPRVPDLWLLLQVQDDSGEPLLAGAREYEAVLAGASAAPLDLDWSPDDLYIVYTGGTTGAPKGVLWRQSDIFRAVLAARRDPQNLSSMDAVLDLARAEGPRFLPASPFMHGSGQWFAFAAFHNGGTVIIPDVVTRFNADDIWATVERERVAGMSIVGDAFARPLLASLRQGAYDVGHLRLIASGGAVLSASVKADLMATIPGLVVVDTLGSSETGAQGQHVATGATGTEDGWFPITEDTLVLDEHRTRFLDTSDSTPGWLARRGAIPLGYLGDRGKTLATFPTVDGVRCSVPGDRVRHRGDGTLAFVGRDSGTINSGGEKIFAEEVESALKQHPSVVDALVVGRPSERWGQEVVAVVQAADGSRPDTDDILSVCRHHLARHKVPKEIIWVAEVKRSPAGKADYAWAKSHAGAARAER